MNNLTNENIDNFLRMSSFTGLMLLYYIKVRFEKKEAFNKSELEKIRTGEYPYGYFVACYAIGLFDYTTNSGIFNITNYNEYLSTHIKDVLIEKAKKHDELFVDQPKWIDDVTRIESI